MMLKKASRGDNQYTKIKHNTGPAILRSWDQPNKRISPIAGKILSLAGNVSSANPPQSMVLPREVFHKTSIWVPNQDSFEHNITNTQSLLLYKNSNLTHQGIIIKLIPISAFLVYDGFPTDLDAITIYRSIKNLNKLSEPAIQALLTLLHSCMTRRLVNDMRTFILSSFFTDLTPLEARTWGLNKFNRTFPTLCSPC